MSDEKTRKMKVNWSLVVKLVAGVGALTGALERYVDLAEKNQVMYQALSTKLNNVSEELSTLKGQNQMLMLMFRGGPMSFEDLAFPAPRAPASVPIDNSGEAGEEAGEESTEEASSGEVYLGSTEVSVELDVLADVEQVVYVEAYQALPVDLDALMKDKKEGKITRAQRK